VYPCAIVWVFSVFRYTRIYTSNSIEEAKRAVVEIC
jgi:hypothetical protein